MLSLPPKRNQLYFIFHLILNQRIIVYRTWDAIKFYFSCRHCRKQRSLKKYKSKDFYLNQGIQKLQTDLDIVNLLEIIKGFRIIQQVLFTKDDQFFLKHQRRDIIDSDLAESGDNGLVDQITDEDNNKMLRGKTTHEHKLRKIMTTHMNLNRIFEKPERAMQMDDS